MGYTEPEINNKNMEQDNQQDENIANSNVKVRVYPNPAERNITVELIGIQEELCSFIIRNTLGINLLEKVIKTDGSPITIDVGKLSNGLYLYEVLNSEKVIIDKGSLVISK